MKSHEDTKNGYWHLTEAHSHISLHDTEKTAIRILTTGFSLKHNTVALAVHGRGFLCVNNQTKHVDVTSKGKIIDRQLHDQASFILTNSSSFPDYLLFELRYGGKRFLLCGIKDSFNSKVYLVAEEYTDTKKNDIRCLFKDVSYCK